MKLVDPTLTILSGGLRLVHIHQRFSGAGIFGIAVRAGSADDGRGNEGLAHFVEHTIFKGTRRRSSWHIINRMETVGGELNAFTTKEETVVYSIFPSGNAPRAIELIADLAVNSQFPEAELEKEREVVIDEINSYRDTPSEAIFDDFEEYALAGTPLSHNILGSPESVHGLGSEDCRRFLSDNYRSENIVAFYSGPQSADHISRLVEKHFAGLPQGSKVLHEASSGFSCRQFSRTEMLDVHQTHVVIGACGPGMLDARRHSVSLFSNIIGGPGMNSLLNVELRERRGLVYSVEASTAMFTTCGLLNVYFGCDASDLGRCLSLSRRIFSGIAGGKFSERRLAMAKKQYIGQLAIASENSENRIMAAARAALFRGEVPGFATSVSAIQNVTSDEIRDIAASLVDASTLVYTSTND